MADRYWVLGTGTWNTSSTLNWSATSGGLAGASVPTAADNVIFDQAGSYTVTLTGALTCLSLTVSAGTVTFTSTGTIAISGSMSLVAATVWNATGTITFNSTTTGNTITTDSVAFSCSITFNGVGGSWQLQDALTSGATRTCTLTAGTLDLNGYTLTTGLFNSNNTNTRVIAFGSGNITITGTSGTVFGGPSSANTGLTTTGTAQVNVTGNGTTTRTVNPGNAAAITGFISFTISAGSDTINSAAGMTFNNLTFTSGFTGTFGNVTRSIFGNLTLDANITSFSSGASTLTFTGTGSRTITTAGETIDCPITFNGTGGTFACQDALTLGSTQPLTMTNGTLQLKSGTTSTVGSFATSGTNAKYLLSTTLGTAATISDASGTNTVQYLTVQDNIATGGATWNALAITNVDAGNNTGWLFSTTPSIGNEITMRLRSFTQPRRF